MTKDSDVEFEQIKEILRMRAGEETPFRLPVGMSEEQLGEHLEEHNRRVLGGDKADKPREHRVVVGRDIPRGARVLIRDGVAKPTRTKRSTPPRGCRFADAMDLMLKGEIARESVTYGWIEPTNPIYGVDGNLLVEDFTYISNDMLEEILNGTFANTNWRHGMLLNTLWQKHPQLAEERRKRAHRKAYRAHLEAKCSALIAQGVRKDNAG